jgi:hypothetical protein
LDHEKVMQLLLVCVVYLSILCVSVVLMSFTANLLDDAHNERFLTGFPVYTSGISGSGRQFTASQSFPKEPFTAITRGALNTHIYMNSS